ncbi:hypothetical protein [Pedobacter immunditicola]|uniref:hypothetical protein n=1 Tax=Pedobacter immunditicola TaxID=3133440 RepID=UPI0030B0DF40
MNKFHSIATDKYIPLSFDNAYLFDQYDRINNFLVFNIDKKFKYLLAKPVKSNFDIEWYSTFKELHQVQDSHGHDFGLLQYWVFYEELQRLLIDISRTNDENVKNWVEIIKTVFNPENNLIFTNGKDISIIWGWKFENNQNQKPTILTDSLQNHHLDNQGATTGENHFLPPLIAESPKETDFMEDEKFVLENSYVALDDPLEEAFLSTPKEIDNYQAVEEIEKKGFLAFLKYFAAKYAWILILLLILVCVILFFKTLKYS